MADNFATTMVKADVDAKSLSDFMSKPSSALVPRRLSDPVNTLDYFLDYLKAIEKVYTQQTGVVNVNGIQVKAITQAVIDALNSAAIDNNTQVDTLVTATPKYVGAVARTLSEKIDDVVNLRDFGLVTADSSIIAAANFAMSSQRSFTIDSNIIIKIPEHFPDLQTALTRITPSKGVIITLRISTGHKINQPVKLLEGGDYSSFYIESVDPVVYLKDDWLPTDNLFTLSYAKSPRIKALFDMQGKGVDGVNASRSSTAYVEPGGGIIAAGRTGAYVNSASTLYAAETTFKDCFGRNVECTAGSTANIQLANLQNGNRDAIYYGSVYARRASKVNAQGCDFSNTVGNAASAHRGAVLNAMEGIFNNITGSCAFAQSGGTVIIDSSSPNNVFTVATAEWGGVVTANNCTATNVNDTAVRCRDGGVFTGNAFIASGATGNNKPALYPSSASSITCTASKISNFDRPFIAGGGSSLKFVYSEAYQGFTNRSDLSGGSQVWFIGTKTKTSTGTTPDAADFNVSNLNLVYAVGTVYG